ncbi:uncharacterized protein [Engystomops pustulosus]|uniref:uncharacterized protein n=1 Tax=Engystomops pustulosus TaxID=76066 RepID=UPI003AFA9694
MSYFFTFLRPYAPLKSMGTYKIRVTYVVATVCCRIYVLYLGIPGTRGGEGRTFLGVRSNMAYVQMERLLALVQAHPILWDKRLEDFHNRALKHKKWEEITAILLPDEWASSSTRERASLVKKVSTRWVSARDQYKREKSEKGRSGSGKLHKKPYLYTSFMRFLDPVMDVGETADNLEESASMQTGEDVLEESFEEQAEDLSTPQPPSTPPPPPPPMRSRRRRQLGVSSLSIAAEREVLDQLRRRRDDSAEDICMRSMVQDLQGVHEDDRMNCRVAMMAVLQIFQKGTPKDKSEVALFLERRRQHVGGLLPPSPPPSTRYPAMAPVFHGPYEGSSAMASHGQATSGPYTRELYEL